MPPASLDREVSATAKLEILAIGESTFLILPIGVSTFLIRAIGIGSAYELLKLKAISS